MMTQIAELVFTGSALALTLRQYGGAVKALYRHVQFNDARPFGEVTTTNPAGWPQIAAAPATAVPGWVRPAGIRVTAGGVAPDREPGRAELVPV